MASGQSPGEQESALALALLRAMACTVHLHVQPDAWTANAPNESRGAAGAGVRLSGVAVAPNVVATSSMALSLLSIPEAPYSPAHTVPSGPARCRVIPFDPLREAAGAAVGSVVNAVASPNWDLALLRVSARFPTFASPSTSTQSPVDHPERVVAVITRGLSAAVEWRPRCFRFDAREEIGAASGLDSQAVTGYPGTGLLGAPVFDEGMTTLVGTLGMAVDGAEGELSIAPALEVRRLLRELVALEEP